MVRSRGAASYPARRLALWVGLVCAALGARSGAAQAAPAGVPHDVALSRTAELALSRDAAGLDDAGCAPGTGDGRLRCLLSRRYSGAALELAQRLYDSHGNVAGIERARSMVLGFRGRVQLLPEWPTGHHLRHLRALVRAHDILEHTLSGLRTRAAQPVRYRHRGIVYRFFRSVRRTTPSAYAGDWTIAYNVAGSLHKDDEAILGTLAHEIFHLNDEDEHFSARALRSIHRAILARCGLQRRCLAPFSPTTTTVRGGTYYAFQPNNGDAVFEYGAELAARYLLEHRALLEHGKLGKPAFKCAAPENARAYRAVADAFFGGVDMTPGCER